MKRRFFGLSSALVFTSLVLVGCLAQSPAPVALYGTSEGAGSAGVHTVTPGENLWSISNRYNIVMRDIVVSNKMSAPFILNSGQRIKLPPPRTYRVRRGDSLYTVSRLYGVSTSEIARMNNLRAPYTIRSGQVLKLPSVTPKTMPAVVKTASAAKAAPVPPVASEALGDPMVTPGRKPDVSKPAKVQKVSASSRAKIPSKTPKRSSSKFMKPVNGKILSSYGSKKNGLHNDGINIKAPRGASVKAAENGVVVYAGNEIKGSGNLILIRHENRWMTAYAHLGDIKVKRGDVLKRGHIIGNVGSTGSVDSPQLHFEVRRGTEAINPSRYLES